MLSLIMINLALYMYFNNTYLYLLNKKKKKDKSNTRINWHPKCDDNVPYKTLNFPPILTHKFFCSHKP